MEVEGCISEQGEGVVAFNLPELTVSSLEAITSRLTNHIINLVGRAVAFQDSRSSLLADEAKFAAEDDAASVVELKHKLAGVGHVYTICSQLTVALRGNILSIGSLEGYEGTQPLYLKLSGWLRKALLVSKNGSLRIPVLVVLASNGPLAVAAEVSAVDGFELEDLCVGDARLVGTYLLHSSDGDQLPVGGGQLELSVALLQGEQLVLGDGVLARLDGGRAPDSSQVLALGVSEGYLRVPEDQRVQCVIVDCIDECSRPRYVLVVGEQDGVAAVLELQGDHGVGPPGDQLIALQLVADDVAVGAPIGVAQVDLRVHGELQRP